MTELENIKYSDFGDFLYPIEYYHFYKGNLGINFKIELLCLENRFAFHLMTENTKVPENLRYFSCNDQRVLEELGLYDNIDYTSKQATLQLAIDLGTAIAKKYCK
ncbi:MULTISPECIES: hypothetical protein [Bacillus cereus group]|uniref:hypothetical protein n=1 Tax=Bacillus cereus group TaxID=86661 RepID=UPI000279EAFE|nr:MULTISPECIES: hypothetical protein [Bacillus cereus group]EJR25894.1 hypothetical protein IIE_06149 [Bacillus cereus VD045]